MMLGIWDLSYWKDKVAINITQNALSTLRGISSALEVFNVRQ